MRISSLPLHANATARRHSQRRSVGHWYVMVVWMAAGVFNGAAFAFPAAFDIGDEDVEVDVKPQLLITEQMFDQMLFGSAVVVAQNGRENRVVSSSSASIRQNLDRVISAEIYSLKISCSLTESQQKKLELAGRGDVDRYFEQIADLRRRCMVGPLDRQQYNDLIMELQSWRNTQSGLPFQETSLLRKTLRRIMTDQQRLALLTLERQRRV